MRKLIETTEEKSVSLPDLDLGLKVGAAHSAHMGTGCMCKRRK